MVYRMVLNPSAEKIDQKDVFNYCRTQGIIGIGWPRVTPQDCEKFGIKATCKKEYPQATHLPKYIEYLDNMRKGDFIWNHYAGNYYLCRVDGKSLWRDSASTTENINVDIENYVSVEWREFGVFNNLPESIKSAIKKIYRTNCVNLLPDETSDDTLRCWNAIV